MKTRFSLPAFAFIGLLLAAITSCCSWNASLGSTERPPAILAAPAAAPTAVAATALQVTFIDVGTGDCLWIHTGDDGIPGNGKLEGYNIVIDGGTFGRIDGYQFASAYLTENNRLPAGSKIEWLILTHAHSDHCGGLSGFLEDCEVKHILDPGYDKETNGKADRLNPDTAYGHFYQLASSEKLGDGSPAEFLWGVPSTLVLNWGSELDPKILWSSKVLVADDINNTSIVIRLGFTGAGNAASFLFMGDAENPVEEHLVQQFGDGLASTALKAGHHGSNSSSTVSFLQRVKPTRFL